MQPLLDFFHFNLLQLELVQTQFVESKEKFQFYQINADILNNIQAQIFLILTLLFIYIGCILFIQVFISMKNLHYFYFGLTVAQFFVKIQNGCFQIKRECEKEGLRQFLIANCWDLLFMSFLQISSQSFNANIIRIILQQFLIKLKLYFILNNCTTTRPMVSIIIGYLILYTFAILISNYFFKETKYTSISRYKIKKFDLLLILKKFLFVGILVLFQRNQEIQSILQIQQIGYLIILALVCNFSLIFIILFRTRKNKFDYFNQIIMEASLFIFCSTVAFYWDLMQTYIVYDSQILFGWLHISILLSVLVINLGQQFYTILVKLKKVLIKKFQNILNQGQNKQMDPYPLIPIKNIMELKL